ncbi:triacylglycerol lipase [Pseudomonas helleri]|uniref:triacylglycerol lipase n=1 Tax=Pseudomonas helleri TaxID=1608996 RepID=UPI00333F81D2
MHRTPSTRYPLLLVHGLFGFERIGPLHYFNGIKQALHDSGAQVFTASVSAAHNNETRGEQLLAHIHDLRQQTGAKRVNLIGHSQGALTARYAAAVDPESVASVTSVSGPNHGCELADRLRLAFTPGQLPETAAAALITAFSTFMSILSGKPKLPQHSLEALNALTSKGVADFNKKYPQGLPATWGGMGAAQVNDVFYYSWSGIIKGSLLSESMNLFDPMHNACRVFSSFFTRESKANDGLVGRFSSHLGTVIQSDYEMDHLDTINQMAGMTRRKANPVALYIEHAQRLKNQGL